MALVEESLTLRSEPALQPFLDPSFDPVHFFNQALPPWKPAATSSALADIANQAQTLLSQLNAQLNRLTNTLTQLTNEILRSGGRLAYEVEILQGDASGLADALTSGLRSDIARFVPTSAASDEPVAELAEPATPKGTSNGTPAIPQPVPAATGQEPAGTDAATHVSRLHSLAIVRARLEDVVRIFGDALEWPIAPSEVSLKSSFISVSAPEPGTESQSRESRGREFAERVRREVADLLGDSAGGEDAFETALSRIEALSDLATVWKGTEEEKARVRFVESLVKLVNERRRSSTSDPRQRAMHQARASVSKW